MKITRIKLSKSYWLAGFSSNIKVFLLTAMLLQFGYSLSYSQTPIYSFNFDVVATGWTFGATGLNGGTNNRNSWVIGVPKGGRGYNDINGQKGYIGNADPTTDHTAANTTNKVAGQGLQASNTKQGISGHYNNSSEWMRSPAINCSEYYNVSLEYYRWANLEPGYDRGFIEVSTNGTTWVTVFNSTSLKDNQWVYHRIDLSAYADKQPVVYLRWRSESDGSVFYSGWNIDDVVISGTYNTNDFTSSISAATITAPANISSLKDTYSEKVDVMNFTLTDAGSGDAHPTIIDTLVIVPGSFNTISDWKKSITNIYLYDAVSNTEIAGIVKNNKVMFTHPSLLSIPDGSSRTFTLSYYLEVNLTSVSDNQRFDFVVDFNNFVLNASGSLFNAGKYSTGSTKLKLDIQATTLNFFTEPSSLVAPNRILLPIINVAATDANGNTDTDFTNQITLSNSGNLTMTGNAVSAIKGVAAFNSCQFTQTGGPVNLLARHNGSAGIGNATSQVMITIANSLLSTAYSENFDGTISGWTTGALKGSNSWKAGSPKGGRGYSDVNPKGYVGNADPSTDYSTNNTKNFVYGQGLSNSSTTQGVSGHYNNSNEWVMSPAINLSNYYNTQLTFWRWANFEAYYDTAVVEISINGTSWINLNQTLFPADKNWTQVAIDISAIADRQSTVYIRWRSVSDASVFYAGWNIDDIAIAGIFSPVTNWTGAVSTDWGNAANWSGGNVPTTVSNVYIEKTTNRPIITGTAVCNEIIVRKNASLEVASTGNLTVYGNVQIETDYQNYGAFIDRGAATIYGNGKVSVYLSAKHWHYISSPVAIANTNQFGEEVYLYNEVLASNNWNRGWVLAENTAIELARGYDVYRLVNSIVPLEGRFNTGTQGIRVTNTNGSEIAEREGWNLVGNPYPSAIDWDAVQGWTKTNLTNATYIWDQKTQNYATYINGVGTNGGSRYIPPMQGFFVRVANPGEGYLGMNNSVRTAITTQKFKSTNSEEEGIKIRIVGGDFRDETVVRFDSNAGYNFDEDFDALKKFSDNPLVPQIYTLTGKGEQLTINTYPLDTLNIQIPVCVRTNVPGTYSFEFEGAWNINPEQTVYLEDLLVDTLIDLRMAGEYTFSTEISEVTDRFILHVGMSLRIEYAVTAPTVKGRSDGNIALTIFGGKQPLQGVHWSNGATTEDLTNIGAGNYIVEITDAAGKTLVDTILVPEGAADTTSTDTTGGTSVLDNPDALHNGILVYTQNDKVHIKPIDTSTPILSVYFYDVSGRVLFQYNKAVYGELILPTPTDYRGLMLVRTFQGENHILSKVSLW